MPTGGRPRPRATSISSRSPPSSWRNPSGDYFRAWGRRIRNGESGALPIIVGLIVIVIFFQIEQSQFLTSGNLVNLFVQAATFVLFGAAEVWVLILSEIDLSIGYVAAVAAFVMVELVAPPCGAVVGWRSSAASWCVRPSAGSRAP